MRRLTQRAQQVEVVTLSTLRQRLQELSNPERSFAVDHVRGNRVTVRVESSDAAGKFHVVVTLPSYPTGHPDDEPSNPNVVLDPTEFAGADTCERRHLFSPLLGEEVLAHYEKLHPHAGLSVTRCC